jgi:hypothetical protein
MRATSSPAAAGSTDVRGAAVLCAALLAAVPVHAQDQWSLVRTENLTLVGDQAGERLRDIGLQLETFRLAVGQTFSNASRPPALPTIVVVIGTRRGMQRFLPQEMSSSSAIAGYFRQDRDANRIVLSLEGFSQSPAVAYHEYTHLLLRGTLTSPPQWLEEGIAEYYGTYRISPDGREVSVGRMPPVPPGRVNQRWIPIADLITFSGGATTLAHDNATASAFYSQSAMLVHYILTRVRGGGSAINRYLTMVAEGRAPADAFDEAFGVTTEAMDERLRTYIGAGEFESRTIRLPRAATGTGAPPIALTAAETRAWQGEIQRSVGWPEGAGDVEAAAAIEPDSAMVQLLLGRTRLATGDLAGGHAALTLAADTAPADFVAQFWKGFWFVRGGAPATEGPAAVRALRRAVRIRPRSADAQALLADALIAAGEPITEARRAIDAAIAIAPERLEFTLKQAEVLIRQRDLDAARGVLTALADAPDAQLAERARELLQKLR